MGVYRLPYEPGTSTLVLQTMDGPWGHEGHARFAVDFRMPIGSSVLAARAGRVVHVEERFTDGNRTSGDENRVVVRHDDGTFGRYYHLTNEGVLVDVGDRVDVGDLIARSGDTGASAGPHLHFDVTESCFQWGCQTLPIRFLESDGGPLRAGVSYRSLEIPTDSVDFCSPEWMAGDVAFLASDLLEGRGPGTRGGEAAARFIAARFLALGMAGSTADDGTGAFLQPVPLRRTTPIDGSMVLGDDRWATGQDGMLLHSERVDSIVTGSGALVDLGYGVHAPELGVSDYDGRSVEGLVVLVRSGLGPEFAGHVPYEGTPGHASLWHKLAAARAHGALGVVVLVDEEGADPATVHPDWGGRGLGLVAVVSSAGATRALVEAAAAGETLTFEVRQSVQQFGTPNVAGLVQGVSDQAPVWITAHYDGLGMGEASSAGDSIYNGARDNASGTAALLCLAGRLAAGPPPVRTTVFVATTAEEVGHIGMAYAMRAAESEGRLPGAVLNIDGINGVRTTVDLVAYGQEGSESLSDVSALLAERGVEVGEYRFQDNMRFAFDTAEPMAWGVPAVTLGRGTRVEGLEGREAFAVFRDDNATYHAPADEFSPAMWSPSAVRDHLGSIMALFDAMVSGDLTLRRDDLLPWVPRRAFWLSWER